MAGGESGNRCFYSKQKRMDVLFFKNLYFQGQSIGSSAGLKFQMNLYLMMDCAVENSPLREQGRLSSLEAEDDD